MTTEAIWETRAMEPGDPTFERLERLEDRIDRYDRKRAAATGGQEAPG